MFQPDLLKNKTILVTGGGSGLGRAMGQRFLELGARLVIASRDEAKLQAAAAEMTASTGGQVLAVPCDVRNPGDVERLFARVWDETGGIDALVNNAAGNFISPTERLSPNGFAAVVGIVLHGTFHCTLAAGSRWLADGSRGNVLNIVTTYAWTGSAFVVPSACAKAGVLAMTRSLAVEWGRHGIRLNAIAPGPFPTPGAWQRLVPDASIDQEWRARIPLQRFGEHRELADLAAFLLSDGSSYINGEVITIDGGEWLQGAGQFNNLLRITPEQWDVIGQQARRAGKKGDGS